MCENTTTNENQENIANQDSDSGFFQMHQNMINNADGYFVEGSGPGSTLSNGFPEVLPQWNFPQPFNPVHFSARDPDPFPMFNPRRTPFGYEPGSASDHHHLRLLTESLSHHPMGPGPFGLHAELQKMTAQEVMDAKALAASKSHSEAERRRRERINNHLAKLRSLLPSTTKTDKASLLAEVIQHVKELKRQTSLIAETSPVPTETDELTVDASSDEIGRPLLKASICCEDRPELLPDLIKTLKELRLKTLKAEITTLGGRVKNVLYVTGDDECGENGDQQRFCIGSIEEALKSVMERENVDESGSGGVKRQRTNVSIVEHRSV